jgi:predicted TIM-barrel enzyme
MAVTRSISKWRARALEQIIEENSEYLEQDLELREVLVRLSRDSISTPEDWEFLMDNC